MPLPKELLNIDIPGTAKLLYAVLLERATLSVKNGWDDESGRVYIIYPIEKLASDMSMGVSAVKRNLSALEKAGLIRRKRERGNAANHIYLFIPGDTLRTVHMAENGLCRGAKTDRAAVRKRAPNKLKEQTDNNKYSYQYSEDDSL